MDRWKSVWTSERDVLRNQGMLRTLGDHPESRFGHNDYLGLRRDPRLRATLSEAIQDGLPTTSTGSRLLSGNLPLFADFEGEFASRAGMPAALLFGSASEANRVAISALVDRKGEVFHDALAHASLIDGILHSGAKRRKFRHNDPDDLRAQLRSGEARPRLVVTESVFSMDGDFAPLGDLLQVCKDEDALLLVDEAHSVGLFGPNRTGMCESLPRSSPLVATTHGFGKALASAGGMLCAFPELLEKIVNTSRAFIFTTAPNPLSVLSAREAWRIARFDTNRHLHLEVLCKAFDEGVRSLGWPLGDRTFQSPIFPLLTNGLEAAVRLSQLLAQHEIHLRPIRPPTVPAGTERLRATLSAELESKDVAQFLEVLARV